MENNNYLGGFTDALLNGTSNYEPPHLSQRERFERHALTAFNATRSGLEPERQTFDELPRRYVETLERVHQTYEAVRGTPTTQVMLSRQVIAMIAVNYNKE